jgi:hypothetical protein
MMAKYKKIPKSFMSVCINPDYKLGLKMIREEKIKLLERGFDIKNLVIYFNKQEAIEYIWIWRDISRDPLKHLDKFDDIPILVNDNISRFYIENVQNDKGENDGTTKTNNV